MCAILFNAPSNMRLKSLPVKAMDSLILRHFPNVMPILAQGTNHVNETTIERYFRSNDFKGLLLFYYELHGYNRFIENISDLIVFLAQRPLNA